MIFWIIVIALLGLGLCAVLIPLTKLNEVSGNSADYDREVYKAQLAELDRDVSAVRSAKAKPKQAAPKLPDVC